MKTLSAYDIAEKFKKRINTYDKEAFIQDFMANLLIKEIKKQRENYKTVFEAGAGTGIFTNRIKKELSFRKLYINDIIYEEDLCYDDISVIAGDICSAVFPDNIDLFCSNAMLQWINDKKSLLEKIYYALSKNGLIAISSFGKDNFLQIKKISGAGLEYNSWEELFDMLSACKMEIIYTGEKHLHMVFPSAQEVLKHIKRTGVNACGKYWDGSVKFLINEYEKKFKKNNGVYLTYHPIWFIARKKNA
ncbi:methyltransferase domain-containing protein [Spirochaetia bacterium 38H-sp]|uniref:Methyltransferase domain-containing protein n=1 Tax=Rarispira pelagica TaxID=3141764 RepID=A0ABU9UC13_9SPIR